MMMTTTATSSTPLAAIASPTTRRLQRLTTAATLLIALGALTSTGCDSVSAQTPVRSGSIAARTPIHEIKLQTIMGEPTTLAEHKGKVMLIVNVASECGFTRQYPGLEELYQNYKTKNFVVLGFPSNDFGGQEPGSNEEIAAFCSGGTYDITFPMYAKLNVKPGPSQHPLYDHLAGVTGEKVSWNFNKYLVSKDGATVKHFGSRTEPDNKKLIAAIKSML